MSSAPGKTLKSPCRISRRNTGDTFSGRIDIFKNEIGHRPPPHRRYAATICRKVRGSSFIFGKHFEVPEGCHDSPDAREESVNNKVSPVRKRVPSLRSRTSCRPEAVLRTRQNTLRLLQDSQKPSEDCLRISDVRTPKVGQAR